MRGDGGWQLSRAGRVSLPVNGTRLDLFVGARDLGKARGSPAIPRVGTKLVTNWSGDQILVGGLN